MKPLNHMISKKFIFLCWVIFSYLIMGGGVAGAKPFKVLILPFTIHAEKDLSYLQKGIADMLSSRLGVDEKVVLLDSETSIKPGESVDHKLAMKLGRAHGSDYVLYGSITVFLKTISTDAHFLDIRKETSAVVFSNSGAKHEDLMTHINLFTSRINAQVFNRKTVSQAQKEGETQSADTEDDSRRLHPDKLVSKRPGLRGAGTSLYKPNAYVSDDESLWRKRFKYQIIGMAVGDMDQDSQKETVLINENSLNIYRMNGQTIQKITQWKNKGRHKYLHVDMGDINKNGMAEIFVTSVDNSDASLMTFVLEYDGKELKQIVPRLNWYLRVLNHPDYGLILLGQKRSQESVFASGIYLLSWKDGEYQSEERMPLARNINLYGFTFGHRLDIEKSVTIAYTKGDHLTILDSAGKNIWKRPEESGGSDIFIKYPSKDLGKGEYAHYYLPLPIHMADIDQDNRFEIITIKNEQKIYSLFDRTRSFKHGSIEILEWNGHGLFPKLLTQKYSEYLSDCMVADLDNDGQNELVFTAVAETDSLLASAKSFLYVIELQKKLAENKN